MVFQGQAPGCSVSGGGRRVQRVDLAVEVADSSLNYDLQRKPLVYASFGVKELWVIDAARRIVHIRADLSAGRYAREDRKGASDRLSPAYAPTDFAFAVNNLPMT